MRVQVLGANIKECSGKSGAAVWKSPVSYMSDIFVQFIGKLCVQLFQRGSGTEYTDKCFKWETAGWGSYELFSSMTEKWWPVLAEFAIIGMICVSLHD